MGMGILMVAATFSRRLRTWRLKVATIYYSRDVK
jgi:hypothetical protein